MNEGGQNFRLGCNFEGGDRQNWGGQFDLFHCTLGSHGVLEYERASEMEPCDVKEKRGVDERDESETRKSIVRPTIHLLP